MGRALAPHPHPEQHQSQAARRVQRLAMGQGPLRIVPDQVLLEQDPTPCQVRGDLWVESVHCGDALLDDGRE